MTDYTLIRSDNAIQMIAGHDHVYLMWDMAKVSDEHRFDIPFPRDRIAKVGGAEFAVYLTGHFPPPLSCYIFDSSLGWYITVINEFDDIVIDGKLMTVFVEKNIRKIRTSKNEIF